MSQKSKKSKNMLLLVILLAIVGIAVGYAALSQTLILNGTAKVASGDSAWNVHFVNSESTVITQCQENDAEIESTDGTEGTFSATLIPGESVTYKVTIINDGTIEAAYDTNEVTDKSSTTNNYVTCTVAEDSVTGTLSKDSGKHTFTVTLTCAEMSQTEFDALPEDGLEAKFEVDFNYVQATSSTSTNTTNTNV
jgi:hypothetical protein